jgi:hypothetical protein
MNPIYQDTAALSRIQSVGGIAMEPDYPTVIDA